MEDCCECGGTGTTTGEDWYARENVGGVYIWVISKMQDKD
jgi:hypothetical protein